MDIFSIASNKPEGKKEEEVNILVMCRIRPLLEEELETQEQLRCIEMNSKEMITINAKNKAHTFHFDYIFDEEATQATIYNVAAEKIIKQTFQGYDGTIIAYGQSLSGKTFTIQGDIDIDYYSGIASRMVDTLLEVMNEAEETMEFIVGGSVMGIKGNKIFDLLDPENKQITIEYDEQHGVYIEGLKDIPIESGYDMYNFLNDVNKNKREKNVHVVYRLTITANNTETFMCKIGHLNLVDLSLEGDENEELKEQRNEEVKDQEIKDEANEIIEDIRKKLAIINSKGIKSTDKRTKADIKDHVLVKGIDKLLDKIELIESLNTKEKSSDIKVLRNVVEALIDNKVNSACYKDSVLTQILQESIGGHARTCVILTLSPLLEDAEKTLETCKFGQLVKNIKNTPRVNTRNNLKELEAAILRLENQLDVKERRIEQLEGFLITHNDNN